MFQGTTRFLLLPTLFILAACSGTTDKDDVDNVASALEQENGGMNASAEAPAFGDPELANMDGFDDAQTDAEDATAEAAEGAKSFHIALIWGHLPPPRDGSGDDVEPAAADWTGSVSVDAGAVGVKKTLRFDARDRIEARTDRTKVDFTSHTLPFVDGLFLRVVVPAGAAPVLHFRTAALSEDIDLGDKGGVSRIANSPNGLVHFGYEDVAGCARGLLFGRWVKARANLGRFRGQVIDGAGDHIGHVRGIWGHAARRDANVFFGKYIAADGEARGLLGGRYEGGHFTGVWGTRDPKNEGQLEGYYSDGYDKADGRGVFLGRWSEKCE